MTVMGLVELKKHYNKAQYHSPEDEVIILGGDELSERLGRKAAQELFTSRNFGKSEIADGSRLVDELTDVNSPELFDKNQYVFLVLGENLRDPEKAKIKGLSIGHYMAESNTAALWYLAVSGEQRRKGYGEALVRDTQRALNMLATYRGKSVNGMYAHVHDPNNMEGQGDDPFDPRQRYKFYQSVVSNRVSIDFRAPDPDPERSSSEATVPYMLLHIPDSDKVGCTSYPTRAEIGGHVMDYYKSYGHEQPARHRGVQKMLAEIDNTPAESFYQPLQRSDVGGPPKNLRKIPVQVLDEPL